MCVLLSVVVVEYEDGGDHAGGHHEHDAVEVGSCRGQSSLLGSNIEVH